MGLHVLTRPARDTKDSSRGPGSPDSRGTAESTSFGAPVAWGASLRRAPAGTHGRATFKDFQLRREPRPPPLGPTLGLPPHRGQAAGTAGQAKAIGHQHPTRVPGPCPLLMAEDTGLRLAGDPGDP